MNLLELSKEIADRLTGIFLRNAEGKRHVYNGAGLGASHQTGWTGLVAKQVQLYGYLDRRKALAAGKEGAPIVTINAGGVNKYRKWVPSNARKVK